MLITENTLRKIIAQEYKKLMEGDVVDFAAARAKRMGAEKSPKKELDQDMVKFFLDSLQQTAEILVKDSTEKEEQKFLWALRAAAFIKTKIKKNSREAAQALVTLGANMVAPEKLEEFSGVVNRFINYVKGHTDTRPEPKPKSPAPPLGRPERALPPSARSLKHGRDG